MLAALVGAALLGGMFAGDASDVEGILPIGGAAVVLVAATLIAIAFERLPAPRIGRTGALLVGAAVALVVWTGVTVWWSVVPDRSWDYFNRTVAYLAFLVLGLALSAAARGWAARLAAGTLAIVVGVTLSWALLAKAIPALDPEGDRVARLREPIGYWNALALVADVGIALGLWVGTERAHRRSLRVAGGLLVYVATLALLLTISRAGVAVAVVVVALWLALGSERIESGLLLLVSSGPAILVGIWAFTRPALTEDVAARSDRVADGALFAVVALVGALLVVVLVALGQRRSLAEDARRKVGRGLVALAIVCVLGGAAAVTAAAADAVSAGRDCSEVVNDPSRLTSLDPNNRLCWWSEAWRVFTKHAPEGAGAGTFEIARKRVRTDARNVLQPHSLPLQQLSDGGVLAFALLVALVVGAAGVCVCALRRLSGSERAAAVALVAVPAAYVVHVLVDYTWDFIAVTAPTFLALGVLAAAGRDESAARRRLLLAVGSAVVAAAVLVSFSFPRLADRAERESTRALASNDFDRARDLAHRARFFNPVSAGPLLALAGVAERQGLAERAEHDYIRAAELQPDNPDTWYALGLFEFQSRNNLCAAYRFLNNAYTLDPAGNQWVKGGPLDVSRDAVNAGGCAPGS